MLAVGQKKYMYVCFYHAGKETLSVACVASISVGFWSKESRPIFRASKTPKVPFFGVSLLPNPHENAYYEGYKYMYTVRYTVNF